MSVAELLEDEWLPRGTQAAPCPCNGYADKVECTDEEVKAYQTCGRTWACCVAAFECRLCGKRFVVHLEAPERDQ